MMSGISPAGRADERKLIATVLGLGPFSGKGSVKETRKVLDQAARDGNLGAYVDSFMDKFGGNLNTFQEKTGISSATLKDIEKIAAAKG